MNLDRTPPTKKRRPSLLGCLAALVGCVFFTVVALVAGIILFRDQIMSIGIQAAGLESLGRTETVLRETAPEVPPIPSLAEATAPPSFSVQATGYAGGTVTNNQGINLSVGQTPAGQTAATITAAEEDLFSLCLEYVEVCRPGGSVVEGTELSDARLDLLTGGAVASALVQLDGIPTSQRIGIALSTDITGTQLVLRGIDINGQLYAEPPAQFVGVVADIEQAANEALAAVVLQAAGSNFTVDRMIFSENRVDVLLR